MREERETKGDKRGQKEGEKEGGKGDKINETYKNSIWGVFVMRGDRY